MDEELRTLKRAVMDAVCAYTAATGRQVRMIDLLDVEVVTFRAPKSRHVASGIMRITVSGKKPDEPGMVWASMV